MANRILYIIQLVFVIFMISCKAYRPLESSSGVQVNESDYVSRYKDLAISEMKRTGIPASITLAQGMIESNYGKSRLALEANNHFGIKCHNDWTGPTIRHNDDKRNECFRKYKKPEESYYDHSDFLKTGSRYSSLFYLDPTDYKGWAKGLKKAGYATNPDYANMLIRKIEEDKLWVYDSNNGRSSLQPSYTIKDPKQDELQDTETKEAPAAVFNENREVAARLPRIMERNRIQYIIVKDGDTRDKLEKEFKLLRWELPRYNELESDFTISVGQILYLQPKREKAEPGKEYHKVADGETMYYISQLYGVKLKNLYEMNRMEEGTEPVTGTQIWLRRIKTVR